MKNLVFIILFFSLSGCQILGIGPIVSGITQGVIYWKNGEAQKYYEFEPEIIYNAAKRGATEDMQMSIDNIEEKDGFYRFYAGENNRFKVKIESVDNNISRLSVRINFMGDKEYTELYFSKVDEQIYVVDFTQNKFDSTSGL
jgi:hypothetical protein